MNASEQRLLATLTKAVILLAKNLALSTVVKDVQLAAGNAQYNLDTSAATKEFEPAVRALTKAGVSASLDHTGGGVFVLYHYLDENPVETTPMVGITPSEDNDGTWLVIGYTLWEDEGSIIRDYVVTDNLALVVQDCAAYLRRWTKEYQIPGTFMVRQDDQQELEFVFVPAGGDAGYFGPHAVDVETGDAVDNKDHFWDRVGLYIDPETETVQVRWEG